MKAYNAIVFPGQGSQRPGMAQDFYDEYTLARDTFTEASDATGLDMTSICFTENDKIDLTEFTQPAILTASIAMFRVMQKEFGLAPQYFAGHSLGEYTALVAAGVIPLSSGVQIVRRRGALMQNAVPEGQGAMAALIHPDLDKLPIADLITRSGAEIANRNSAEQLVISGQSEAVKKAGQALAEQYPEMSFIPLKVSAPFHSSLMRPIEEEFRTYLTGFERSFQYLRVSYVASNYSGSWHNPDTMIDSLVKQISGEVRWIENMKLIAATATPVIEVGPNKPLTKFFQTLNISCDSVINLRSLGKLSA